MDSMDLALPGPNGRVEPRLAVEEMLDSGTLVNPFNHEHIMGEGPHLIAPKETARIETSQTFQIWLHSQLAT